MDILVAGSGAWGTALAKLLFENGHDVTLWSHRRETSERLERERESPLLKGVALPDLGFTWESGLAAGKKIVVMATPSFAMRSAARTFAPYLDRDAVLVSASKGIEAGTSKRMSEIAAEETGRTVAVLCGPSHAEEVGRGVPTGCVAACEDISTAEMVQDAFMNGRFRVYASGDAVGVEVSAAFKNVIALCAGISDGLGCGDNTKALLMTRGLTEIARLGRSMGGRHETFAGLAGVGDLIVTCTSMHSRNRRAGILIGQGRDVQDAMKEVGAVVEGYYAARSAHELAARRGVEMPICEEAYRVLYEGASPSEAIVKLMGRDKRHESEYAGWE